LRLVLAEAQGREDREQQCKYAFVHAA
jgi:hypothetical protein